MTDILTNDKAIAAGTRVAQPGQRANQILLIALAATVAVVATFVGVNVTSDDSPVAVERTVSAEQLRWEGLAAAESVESAALAASQGRWEGLAQAITADATARNLASQLRWEGLAATSDEYRSLAAGQARWEALAREHGAG